MFLDDHLDLAIDLARRAGKAIMEIYNAPTLSAEQKADGSPLTEADRRADELITAGLLAATPGWALLSEERADDAARLDNPWCWIVDPLDGTKEFLKRNGEFTVNIALAHEHRVVLGVVFAPALGDLYGAAKGRGSFLERDGARKPIRVSDRTGDLRLVISRSHASPGEELLIARHNFAEIKRSGSSLKGCLVAAGEAELYYRFNPTMEWDTAAMQCLVEEAGGIMRQMDGTELLYNRADSLNAKGFYVLNREENRILLPV